MPVEAMLSDEQKQSLEEARQLLGFRSRQDLFLLFADNAAEVAKAVIVKFGGRKAYLEAVRGRVDLRDVLRGKLGEVI